ncbi:MAG: class I SAM-dependent RNA methyltransferase [Bdellovibrio sp.]|nr:class I SAM-dependent RNA methyltransferase [Bdellovibrio sp.]
MVLKEGCELQCTGCRHRGLTEEQSLAQKKSWVKELFSNEFGEISAIRTVHGEERWHYRRKVLLHAEWQDGKEKGHWKFGLLRRVHGSFDYEVVPIHDCPIHQVSINRLLQILSMQLPMPDSFPLVNLQISGTVLSFVLKTSKMPQVPAVNWEEIGVSGVYFNLNPSAGNRVFANKGWHLIWGNSKAQDEGWIYGPESFTQQIKPLHLDSVERVKAFFSGSVDRVVDLYCGTGRTLCEWLNLGLSCVGVELNGEALECARQNLKKTSPRFADATLLRGRSIERLPQVQKWCDVGRGRVGVYLNPPRTGLENEVLEWVTQRSDATRVAYLSCNPTSLARDVRILARSGFSVVKIIPYDFFPQTHHVEVLVLLVREAS